MAFISSNLYISSTLVLRKIYCFIVCCLYLTSLKVFSQHTSLINYSIGEGLPSSEVYQIHLDRNGFLWFATDNGVARFDGKDFERFNIKDSLRDPVVFGLHEDIKGRIWFRTFTGKLSYFENGKIYPYQHNRVTSKIAARAIITDMQFDSLDNLSLSVGKFVKLDRVGKIVSQESIEPGVLEYKKLSATQGLVGSMVILKRIKRLKIFDKFYDIKLSDTTQWLQSSYSVVEK
ncbi:MAG: hypothetical protein JNL53_20155 [Cyclobacteriaceae bacterium]|nr:hypothetical protein [Cyclobacteriaceae bacterium]